MAPVTDIAAAILAGGDASRLGGINKGLLEVRPGVSIVERHIARLAAAGIAQAIICANDVAAYAHIGIPVVPDRRPAIGPLAGIEAALYHYAGEFDATLFLPCDLPGIAADHIRALAGAYLAENARIAVAQARASFFEPLCVVVHNDLRNRISSAIDAGQRTPRRLWEDIGTVRVPFDSPKPFFNINTPEDLQQWRDMTEET